MKYLVLLAVLLIAYMWWRSSRLSSSDEERKPRPGKTPPPGEPQDMVSCPVCSVHLPRGEALPGPDGKLYCSAEHRLRGGGG